MRRQHRWSRRRDERFERRGRVGVPRWRRLSQQFEQLEERALLTTLAGQEYDQVSAAWFEEILQGADPPVSFGPAAYEARQPNLLGTASQGEAGNPQRWIVRLSAEAVRQVGSVAESAGLLNRSDVDFHVIRGLGLPGLLLVESQGVSHAAVQASLRGNLHVAYFEPERVMSAQAHIPKDPFFSFQWGLRNLGQMGGMVGADIDATKAWDLSQGKPKVTVGVIDTGVDYTHPDLYLNIWINQGEIDPINLRPQLVDADGDGLITFRDLNAPANHSHVTDFNSNGYIDAGDLLQDSRWEDGDDDDGNGLRDDLIGWDFVNHDNDPMDDAFHGTHVAGIVGAVGDNAVGVAGVAWSSTLMVLKAGRSTGEFPMGACLAAVNYATQARLLGVDVPVTSNSWGGNDYDKGLYDTIAAARDADMLFVAAAGNASDPRIGGRDIGDYPFFPAGYDLDNIIAVAASSDRDELTRISNFGDESVDIAAPGQFIYSTVPNSGYSWNTGTSMAAPHVAGVAALVWSEVPHATAAEVRKAILEGAESLASLQGKVAFGRRLNAFGALSIDTVPPQATLNPVADITIPGTDPLPITVNYTDNQGLDLTSIDDLDLLITRLGHSGETVMPTYSAADSSGTTTDYTAVYYMAPPGGRWDAFADDEYEISPRIIHGPHLLARRLLLICACFAVDC